MSFVGGIRDSMCFSSCQCEGFLSGICDFNVMIYTTVAFGTASYPHILELGWGLLRISRLISRRTKAECTNVEVESAWV